MSWIWLGILLIVVGVLLFVFMYTLNKKQVYKEDDKKMIINDYRTIVEKPLGPGSFSIFDNINDHENNLYEVSYYQVGDTSEVLPVIESGNALFIVKYDLYKNILYTKTIGVNNSGNDNNLAIHVDTDNNLYIAGDYNSNISININGIILPQTNNGDRPFILKLDPNGVAVAAIVLPIDSTDITINSLNQIENNIYITGFYSSDSDINLNDLTLPDSDGINVAYLIGCYNNLSSFLNVQTLGTIVDSSYVNFTYNTQTQITTVIGSYVSNAQITIKNGKILPSTNDILSVLFIQYDKDFNIINTKTIISNEITLSSNLQLDSSYNNYFYFTYTGNQINIDGFILPQSVSQNNVLIKIDNNLTVTNISNFNSINTGIIIKKSLIFIDLSNNLYVFNNYINTSNVDLGNSLILPPVNLTLPNTDTNFVLLKYNQNLNLVDAVFVPGTSINQSVTVNSLGNIYANLYYVTETQSIDLGNSVILPATNNKIDYTFLEYIQI